MSAERPVIVVTPRSFGMGGADPSAWLEERGYRVEKADHRHTLDSLRAILPEAVAWIAGTGPITAEHVELAPRLRVVARYGVGVDAVDRAELARRSIVLTNTKGANTDAVADHAVGLMLAALRHTVAGDRAVRAGGPPAGIGRELGGCTVGLVGFGAVGRAVSRRLRGFGARILAHDPYLDTTSDYVSLVDLPTLIRQADILSLHRPPAAEPVIDGGLLGRLRRGAILVNTARAELVDEQAAAEALRSGQLGGMAVDVLTAERSGTSPLLDAPNATVTPHIAGHTVDAIDRMGTVAAADVVRVLEGEQPRHLVPPPTSLRRVIT